MKFANKFSGRRPALAPDASVIRALAALLAETGLTEIEYAVGDHRIRVAREPSGDASSAPTKNGHAAASVVSGVPGDAAPGPTAQSANGAGHAGALTAPLVGIAYLAPEPGAAPFVQLGEMISEGQTLLIIEAMKVMNQIRAPHGGRVARIFAEDGEPVEYGAPLMLIE